MVPARDGVLMAFVDGVECVLEEQLFRAGSVDRARMERATIQDIGKVRRFSVPCSDSRCNRLM